MPTYIVTVKQVYNDVNKLHTWKQMVEQLGDYCDGTYIMGHTDTEYHVLAYSFLTWTATTDFMQTVLKDCYVVSVRMNKFEGE